MTARTGVTLEAHRITKQYGQLTAVNQLSFAVTPGTVTGLFGPAGAGKSTALRMLLGLVTPSAGTVRASTGKGWKPRIPALAVGAVLGTGGVHPRRRVSDHLLVYRTAIGAAPEQDDVVLAKVGLTGHAGHLIRDLTPAERQRLALATALLGNPGVLVIDEPDPAAAAGLAVFLRSFADNGGSVLVASQAMGWAEKAADQAVVISGGRLIYRGSMATFRKHNKGRVHVASPMPYELAVRLCGAQITDVRIQPDGKLLVTDATEHDIAAVARAGALPVTAMATEPPSLDRMLAAMTAHRPHATTGVR